MCFIKCHVSEHEDINYVYRTTHRGDIRRQLIKIIHSRRFQLILGILLLLDVLVLFSHIFLDSYFPPCFVIDRNIECLVFDSNESETLEPSSSLSSSNLGLLASDEEEIDDIFDSALEPSTEFFTVKNCLSEDNHFIELVEEYFFFGSVTILAIFEVELLVLLVVLGWYGFFRNFGYIFDFFIITISLVLEVVLKETEAGAAVGVIIGARVWRLVRIGHGIMYSSATRRKAVGELLSVPGSDLSVGNRFDLEMDRFNEDGNLVEAAGGVSKKHDVPVEVDHEHENNKLDALI